MCVLGAGGASDVVGSPTKDERSMTGFGGPSVIVAIGHPSASLFSHLFTTRPPATTMADEENDAPAASKPAAGMTEEDNAPIVSEAVVRIQSNAPNAFSERPTSAMHKAQSSSFRNRTDLETGKPLEQERGNMARAMSTRKAMGSHARRRSYIKKDFVKALSPLKFRRRRSEQDIDPLTTSMHGRLTVQASHVHTSDSEGDEESGGKPKGIQYRLSAQTPRQGMLYRIMKRGSASIYEDAGNAHHRGLCCGVSPNYMVTMYLNWTFRASFFKVIFSAALGFYTLTLSFALLIYLSGLNHTDCVHVNGESFGVSGSGNRFGDAYALSWTTFSTVVCRKCMFCDHHCS